MPNVFGAGESVDTLANGARPATAITCAPSVSRTYNVGVAERNGNNLRFSRHLGDGTFETLVLPLAKQDGSTVHYAVEIDVGLAASTGRWEDVGRFKVPQLRGVKDNAPYFHDNSADTLEEVIEYFTSEHYNNSADGQRYPIYLSAAEQKDLLEFLLIL